MLTGIQAEGQEKENMSLEKLKKSCIGKMRTIMIGAISDIENISSGQDYVEQEEYEHIRKSILDRGNNLIRIFEEELKQYTILYKGNFYKLDNKGN